MHQLVLGCCLDVVSPLPFFRHRPLLLFACSFPVCFLLLPCGQWELRVSCLFTVFRTTHSSCRLLSFHPVSPLLFATFCHGRRCDFFGTLATAAAEVLSAVFFAHEPARFIERSFLFQEESLSQVAGALAFVLTAISGTITRQETRSRRLCVCVCTAEEVSTE